MQADGLRIRFFCRDDKTAKIKHLNRIKKETAPGLQKEGMSIEMKTSKEVGMPREMGMLRGMAMNGPTQGCNR